MQQAECLSCSPLPPCKLKCLLPEAVIAETWRRRAPRYRATIKHFTGPRIADVESAWPARWAFRDVWVPPTTTAPVNPTAFGENTTLSQTQIAAEVVAQGCIEGGRAVSLFDVTPSRPPSRRRFVIMDPATSAPSRIFFPKAHLPLLQLQQQRRAAIQA